MTECKKGEILRKGFTIPKTTRTSYYKCPRGMGGDCSESQKSLIKGGTISARVVPPTCIKDIGKKGKTPQSEKWAPKVAEGELSRYFEGMKMTYDIKSCVKAGVRASITKLQNYKALSGAFIMKENLQKRTYPKNARKFETCRQAFLIGVDPTKSPKSETYRNINLSYARDIRKEVYPNIQRSL